MALLWKVTGIHEAVARLLSVCFSVISVLYLFLLVRAAIDERTALWAAGLMAVTPLFVFYGRVIMPEPLMLCASIAGIHHFLRWVQSDAPGHLLVSAAAIALAALVKLPALYLGLPLVWLAWRKRGVRMFISPQIAGMALFVLGVVAMWYHHAHQLKLESGLTFGIWEYGSDKWGNWELVLSWRYWNTVLFNHMAERLLTYTGFIVLLIGLCLPRRGRYERLFDVWMLALVVYLVIVARGNYVHEYYQLPLMLPAFVYMAKVFSRGLEDASRTRVRTIAIVVAGTGVLVLGGVRFADYLSKEDPANSEQWRLAQVVAGSVAPQARIVTLDDGDPTLLWLCGRKGWHAAGAALSTGFIDSCRDNGAVAFVGTRSLLKTPESHAAFDAITRRHRVVHSDGAGFITDLRAPALR